MQYIAAIVSSVAWVAGVVLANGFWSTIAAIFIPFWSWYLVVERAMQMTGII